MKPILFISVMLLIMSCKETVVDTIDNIDNHSKNGVVQLSANKVEIGQKITAHFINMDSVYVYSVTLNQKEVTFSQKDDSTVSLIVPYTTVGNDVGNFVFYCWMKTDSFPDTVLVSNQINYKYENLPIEPYVKLNTNEKLTQSDSWHKDFNGEKQGWSIQTNQDTIKFIRHIICHDECGTTETVVFLNNGNNTLPKFLYALYNKWEWMKPPINEQTTSMCKLIIDEWDDTSVYSGTFTSQNYCWVFWYKK